jgi:hypothetical protein
MKRKKPKRPSVLCVGHNRAGRPCQLAPIRGGTVCHKHGGSAPQVRAKANERLKALVHPAIDRLVSTIAADPILLMVDGKVVKHKHGPLKGTPVVLDTVPAAVALSAARDALDRAGYRPPDEVSVRVDIGLLLAEGRDRLAKAKQTSETAVPTPVEPGPVVFDGSKIIDVEAVVEAAV